MNSPSKWIDIQTDEGTFSAYLALPRSGERSGPGIVLIQEIFGVNDHIREVAEHYASDGYTVLAPDLFWRSEPRVSLGYSDADRTRAFALMKACDIARAAGDVGLTAHALRSRIAPGESVAAVGYCLGGRLAYQAAAAGAVDKAVAYYGGGIDSILDQAEHIRVPLLFHFGARDAHIPQTAVEAIRQTFTGRPDVAVHVYENAEHGFNCPMRPAFHRHSAALARGRTLTFLETPQPAQAA
ncbi:dienelactone hydrolase family protein [Pararobbsia silviterrae]|uniref:Dienelactone hydrolase family protein n=1 Tax=Pararobbsia silviterrae TaxID=1792498 RepID=A0A494Y5E6_9BURK|nr:dienelactone hydrolase family protein [Pararobbsia silviterrae]RKP57916.1 dienelactone hydrolase family protein [Pararobbsia silviterrae]